MHSISNREKNWNSSMHHHITLAMVICLIYNMSFCTIIISMRTDDILFSSHIMHKRIEKAPLYHLFSQIRQNTFLDPQTNHLSGTIKLLQSPNIWGLSQLHHTLVQIKYVSDILTSNRAYVRRKNGNALNYIYKEKNQHQ